MVKTNEFDIKIENKIKRIKVIEATVRDFIRVARYQNEIQKEPDKWNQIFSSIEVIEDTCDYFQDYLDADYPSNTGLKYIYTYGLLQALFIQQDAMKNLSDAFGLKFEFNDRLSQIRLLRNASIGHPTKNRTKGVTYFNYISRPSLDKNGFTLIRSFDQGNSEYHDIEFLPIVYDQLFEIELGYKSLCEKLSEVDKLHRLKF